MAHTQNQARCLTAAETAKLVRKALKAAFPGQKFSVTSDTYSMGAAVHVSWTDGPAERRVSPVVSKYSGSGFDGSIDMKYHMTHWLRPDGSVFLHHTPGTEGSRGYVPAEDNSDLGAVMPEDAELVRFGADSVSCQRHISNYQEVSAEAEEWFRAHYVCDGNLFGVDWVESIVSRLVYGRDEGESWRDVAERVV